MRLKYKFDKAKKYGAPVMSDQLRNALARSDDLFNFFYAVYVNYINNIRSIGDRYEVVLPQQFHKKLGDHMEIRNIAGRIEVISNKQLAQEIIDKSPELTGLTKKYNTDNYVCKGAEVH